MSASRSLLDPKLVPYARKKRRDDKRIAFGRALLS